MTATASLPCPDCGGRLVPKVGGTFGRFFGCENFPRCRATHGAHQTSGEPLGEPADALTRHARREAHRHFDPLWQSGRMTRYAAYGFLRTVLFVPRERAHISMLNKEQCERLITECKKLGVTPSVKGDESWQTLPSETPSNTSSSSSRTNTSRRPSRR